MAGLSYKIEAYLGRKAKFGMDSDSTKEIELRNDGAGDYIFYWADSIEKSKPTDSQLNSADTQATKDYNNFHLKKVRRKAYGSIGDQLDDIYHNGIDAWKVKIKKVKDDNPKS
tara:strand:- start:245 stop:583 length:339 start_codon:yes stop_codon:yes gene_type:complete